MDESVIRELEKSAKLAGMKLSAAMRLGAAMRPQCTGLVFARGKSCAIGAAYEAFYGHPGDGVYMMSDRINGKMILPQVAKIAGLELGSSVLDGIWIGNDKGQTREQIADWLESIGY